MLHLFKIFSSLLILIYIIFYLSKKIFRFFSKKKIENSQLLIKCPICLIYTEKNNMVKKKNQLICKRHNYGGGGIRTHV